MSGTHGSETRTPEEIAENIHCCAECGIAPCDCGEYPDDCQMCHFCACTAEESRGEDAR
jgi:hypothetical protein